MMGLLALAACATAPPGAAPRNRYSPAEMRSGPPLDETGRFGVTQISRAGVRIEDARADGAPPPLPAKSRRRRRGHATAVTRPARGER